MTTGEAWGMMVGLGLALTAITVLLNFLERKFSDEEASSEKFNTAGRSVKTGLTGSVIVSQWTWAATLLQSSNVAWRYGITVRRTALEPETSRQAPHTGHSHTRWSLTLHCNPAQVLLEPRASLRHLCGGLAMR